MSPPMGMIFEAGKSPMKNHPMEKNTMGLRDRIMKAARTKMPMRQVETMKAISLGEEAIGIS